mgnify:CR=1 FL=1
MLRNINDNSDRFLDIPYVGVMGGEVPLDGTHGGSVLANESLNALKRYRAKIKTAPTSGTLWLNMDGSGSLVGAVAGQYTLEYYVYEDGVQLTDADDIAIATFTVGITITPDGISPEGGFGDPTISLDSFDQTITPVGIPPEGGIGDPGIYLSGGLLTMTPDGIAAEGGFGDPTITLTNQGWTNVPGPASEWVDYNDPDTNWTEI